MTNSSRVSFGISLIKDLGTSEILSEKISPKMSVRCRSLQIPVVCRLVTAEQMGMFITSCYTEATSPVSAVSGLLYPPFRDSDNNNFSAVKNKGAWFLLAPVAGIGCYQNPYSFHQEQFGWLLDIERCDFLHARDVLSHRYQLLVILYTINDNGPELVQFFLLAGILGRHF
jgi:hypothetical protein